jgi:DNA repair protein RadD
VCPECKEIVHASKKECPACGFVFPPPIKEQDLRLREDDIMGRQQALKMEVNAWLWSRHISNASGKEMLKVRYYGSIYKEPITEYFPVTHGGYAGEKAMNQLLTIADKATVVLTGANDLSAAALVLSAGKPPAEIKYHKDGKYHRVDERIWI